MKPIQAMSHAEREAAHLPCFCKACRPAQAAPITRKQALAYYGIIRYGYGDTYRWRAKSK
jgi:hypothetical protein